MLKLDSEKGKQYLSGKYTYAVVDGDKVTIDGQYSFNGESGRKVAELISELSSAKALQYTSQAHTDQGNGVLTLATTKSLNTFLTEVN